MFCGQSFHSIVVPKSFARLGSVDQLAFRGVCKSWRAAALSAPREEVKQLCVIYKATSTASDPKHIYNFVDYSSPTLSAERPVYSLSFPNLNGCSITAISAERPVYSRSFTNLNGCSFITAKHGWLLVGRPVIVSVINTFFYDPFSSTTINLPIFFKKHTPHAYNLGDNRLEFKFDFIGPPTLPDCIVMAVFFCNFCGWLFSTTCRRGQPDWAPLTEYRGFRCVWLPTTQMVIHEGSFYCVSAEGYVGKVLAFSPETNTISTLSGHPRQVEEAWNFGYPLNKVLCDLMELGMACDPVDRLGGMEVLRSRRKHESSVTRYMLPWVEGKQVVLGEVETGYPHYRSFLRMEEGQFLVLWYPKRRRDVLGN